MGRKEHKVNIKSVKGKLSLDYYVHGERVRRSTGLDDTAKNRAFLKKDTIPKVQTKILLGEYGSKKPKLLEHYSTRYLKSKETLVSFKTKASRVRKINDFMGKYSVNMVTRSKVKDLLFLFQDKPYTAKEYLTEIRGILDVAVDDEVIDRNPARTIKVGKLGKPDVDPFSEEEVRAILEHSTGMFRNYLGIALNTGMRPGEVLGLMRNDIGDMLHIRRTITRNRVKDPKTIGSKRTIPMFDIVKFYINEQLSQSKALYLFEKEGEHLKDSGYFRDQWKATLKKAGVRYRKFYNTRHTFITAMLNSGQFSIMQIAQIVGHTSPRMIMSHYAGFIKSEHLKVDVSTNLFGHNTGIQEKNGEVENSSKHRSCGGGV